MIMKKKKILKLVSALIALLMLGVPVVLANSHQTPGGGNPLEASRLSSVSRPASGNPIGRVGVRVEMANAVNGIDAVASFSLGSTEPMHQTTVFTNNSFAVGHYRRTRYAIGSSRTGTTFTGLMSFRRNSTGRWASLPSISRSW